MNSPKNNAAQIGICAAGDYIRITDNMQHKYLLLSFSKKVIAIKILCTCVAVHHK